ncbi:hypothetical protein LX87_02328 [Larkinella arboricola]|uniref:Uncharacterized protein n=1 Tax=Larkinella arboricola TaxID=643671 RepID=A0A327X391_LARAB|nr:hypothetical protein [Larkinella arboricola]RAJ97428.1 hypothetical protein LX87_02328 [Larkinella arboricola]
MSNSAKKVEAIFNRHSEAEIQYFDTPEEAIQFLENGLKTKEIQPVAVISNYKVVWRHHNNRGKAYTDDYIKESRARAL